MASSLNPHSDSDNRRFVAKAMTVPLLEADREQMLALAWRDDRDEHALHELVTAYMRLVIATASRYRGYGLPIGDLVQEGCVGLMQAAARFEPERLVRFSTYASWWIRSAMQEYILRNWSIVRSGTSASQKALFFNLRWLRAKIERDGQSQLTSGARDKIAKALKVPASEVDAMALRLSARDQSLNAPIGDEGGEEWEDFLTDPGPTPEEQVMDRLDGTVRARWLTESLTELSQREQLIVRERMLSDDRATLEDLGSRLGITKERVRQIEAKAFRKLQESVLRKSQDGAVA